MKPSSAGRYPVSSFGPELLALLQAGARAPKAIEGTYADMSNLRVRCSLLRSAMKRELHPLSALVSRCSFTLLFGLKAHDYAVINRLSAPQRLKETDVKTYSNYTKRPKDKNVPSILLVAPFDLKFRDTLARAGVKVDIDGETPTSPPPTVPETSEPPRPRTSTDDFLDEMWKE